jgi:AcrR family transcriptional regulator
MARPKVHDAAAGEALLDAAVDLLRREGPGAVSVRAVADASGVSFRAVYAVFGSKQALIDAIAERGYRSLAGRVGGVVPSGDARQDLVSAGVDGFRGFAMEETEVFRLTFERVSAAVLRQERVSRAAYASYRALATHVARLRAAGGIHEDRSDEVCVLTFHSLCQGLAVSELAAVPPPDGPGFWPMARHLDLTAVWRDALTGLVGGFASPPVVAQ